MTMIESLCLKYICLTESYVDVPSSEKKLRGI
jgi:hypothetical protein